MQGRESQETAFLSDTGVENVLERGLRCICSNEKRCVSLLRGETVLTGSRLSLQELNSITILTMKVNRI